MSLKALSDYTVYSRYSHYLPDKKRREIWDESVSRIYNMHREKYKDAIEKFPELLKEIDFAESQQKKKRVLASQRSLQFAGNPIFRHSLKIFNCTATYIDRPRAFQEIMYVLLCGAGVGFSVQKHHIEKLPSIKPVSNETKKYYIEDSIEGWADAVGVLMASYFKGPLDGMEKFEEYRGKKIQFDYSKIRPEGSLIAGQFKAPGPIGLRNSLEKMRTLLEKRIASNLSREEFKLRPIDAYDLVMHSSDAVLSGGVRRSATICQFSHDDEEMLKSKTGNWFIENPQRARSNNSAVLVKGEISRKEFSNIIKSTKEFGEPGFVWVVDKDVQFNPCVTKDTIVMTANGPRPVKHLIGTPFKAVVNGKIYNSSDRGFFSSGVKQTFELLTKEGFKLSLTNNHKVLLENGKWVESKNLKKGDKIVINNHSNFEWSGFGTEKEGWLVGSLLGDGCFSKKTACLDYWGENRKHLTDFVIDSIYSEKLNTYNKISDGEQIATVEKTRITSTKVKILADKVGIGSDKNIKEEIFYTSSNFIRGFLSGWFDANGAVQGNQTKGISIRLSSTNLKNLEIAQKLLLALGIYSKIYKNRRNSGCRILPDGKGNKKSYFCKPSHELVISKDNILLFKDRIGFVDKDKNKKLSKSINSYKKDLYKTKFIGTFKSLEKKTIEDVYDCTIDDVHAFDANGLYVHNCVEIGMYPKTVDGKSGWSACNLTEINGKFCDTEEKFLQACRASAIIGTLQAGYTTLPYLGKVSEEIFKHEALLGCSITGIMDNPEILLSPEIQKKGAEEIKRVNEKIAKMLSINPAARTTCVKPAGSTSCVLGTASGIHPHHARRYIRRVQANKSEFCLKVFENVNPIAVEESVWSANKTDKVISFLCEVPSGAITKNQLNAIDLLEKVKSTQQNWVEFGTRKERCIIKDIRHNVSNTVVVKDDEWDVVEKFIFDNQKWFAGISLLPASGDLDYPQAPFSTVLTPSEMVKEYGDASVFASGLVVDGLKAFDNNLWKACDTLLGRGEVIEDCVEPVYPQKRNNKELAQYFLDKIKYDESFYKKDWIRRANQFSERYFNGDVKKMTHCLKYVSLWKTWCDLKREYKEIDWKEVTEDEETHIDANTLGAQACSGGNREIV